MNNFQVARIGVKLACEILKIPVPEINFINENDIQNVGITGLFNRDEYKICFNEKWLLVSQWIEVIITAFHESRHAYQWYSIINNKNECFETLIKWKSEYENYITVSLKNCALNDLNYLEQDIELDAIRFTHYKIKELFGVETIIPKDIESKVLNNSN